MTSVVVDASAVIAWVVPGQSTVATDRLVSEANRREFIAPLIFLAEVQSGLLKLERQGVLKAQEVDRGLTLIGAAEIEIEPTFDEKLLSATFQIARSKALALYDAFYVELALRLSLPLASRDGRQLDAALQLGARVMDLRESRA